jgi:hypothetical protein
MDSPNSSPGQEKEGKQQPSELPILSGKDYSLETPDHVPPLVSETTTRLQMPLLVIAAVRFATRRRNNTLATEPFQPVVKVLADLERDDPVCLSSSSTCWSLWTPMGFVRVQAH